jgi:hypothetical protein
MNPRHPIYVISKGRYKNPLTVRALEKRNIPFHIVIEPQEFDNYARVIDPAKIKVLPFSNLGMGSIPARNWVFEDSLQRGAQFHWILDDNIRAFRILNNNVKYYTEDGASFKVIEDFVDRYTNIALAGMNYTYFVPRKDKKPPVTFNTRIYSIILINNSIPFRWRGRYNEDTDLSLRALKAGWCTVLFNSFLADKQTTMSMKGGNTDMLYQQNDKMDGRYLMALSLQQQHPDVTKIVRKWGRWQHSVDYRPFEKNALKKKRNYQSSDYDLKFIYKGKSR